MLTFRAKKSGICKICEKPIKRGSMILWDRGWGVAHDTCFSRNDVKIEHVSDRPPDPLDQFSEIKMTPEKWREECSKIVELTRDPRQESRVLEEEMALDLDGRPDLAVRSIMERLHKRFSEAAEIYRAWKESKPSRDPGEEG